MSHLTAPMALVDPSSFTSLRISVGHTDLSVLKAARIVRSWNGTERRWRGMNAGMSEESGGTSKGNAEKDNMIPLSRRGFRSEDLGHVQLSLYHFRVPPILDPRTRFPP
ncbi:hypothetical protein PM082_007447 [Marasmius tenuissimus]|nr:hypothetical protein PM082_007447 [Marasmius tenuissimus]